MNISTATGMIPGTGICRMGAPMRIRDTATTVESAWDSLKGALLQFRTSRLRVALRRALDERSAELGKAYESAWTLVSVTYKRTNQFFRGHFATTLVLVLGVLISSTGFLLTSNHFQNRSQRAFDEPAAHYTAILSQEIDRYLEVINSVGTFMAASNEVDRWEFFALVGKSLPRFPGIQALEWIPRVPAEKRSDYEKQGEKDGLYGFQFTEKDTLGNTVPARERDEYYPVYTSSLSKATKASWDSTWPRAGKAVGPLIARATPGR